MKSQFSWILFLKYQKERQVNPISREQSCLLQQAWQWNSSSLLKSKLVSTRNQGRPDFEEKCQPSVINIPLTMRAMWDDKPPKLFITSKSMCSSIQTLKSYRIGSVWEGLETFSWQTTPRRTLIKGYNGDLKQINLKKKILQNCWHTLIFKDYFPGLL